MSTGDVIALLTLLFMAGSFLLDLIDHFNDHK